MKLITFNKKLFYFLLLLMIMMFTSVMILSTIKIEQSIKVILAVDNDDGEYVLVDSNSAYKLNNLSKVILNYNDQIIRCSVDSNFEKIQDNIFRYKINLPLNNLIKGSQVDAWIIYDYKSLIEVITHF